MKYCRSVNVCSHGTILHYIPCVINPQSACVVMVIVAVSCVCVRVCSNPLLHTMESRKRGTNGFIAIRERFKFWRFN